MNKVDSGPIYMQGYFKLDGTELNNEIRYIQRKKILNLNYFNFLKVSVITKNRSEEEASIKKISIK